MQPQPSRRPQPELGEAWEGVRKWQSSGGYALSAADKLAWLFLWLRSRQGRERIAVTAAEVAADQNVTSDAGRQRLKNLRDVGLMLVRKEADARGVWIVELPNPERVALGLSVKWDAQRVMEFFDEQSHDAVAYRPAGSAADGAFAASWGVPPAEEPTEDPRLRAEEPTEDPPPPLLSSNTRRQIPSSILSSSSRENSDLASASRSGGTSVGSSERRNALPALQSAQADRLEAVPPKEAATLMAGVLARIPSAGQIDAAAREYAALIVRRVNCPQMAERSALKIARSVSDGHLLRRAVDDLLDNLDAIRAAQRLLVPASVYFHVGMRRIRSRAQSGEAD